MALPSDNQIQTFAQAVAALGGQEATARYLQVSARSVRFWLSGQRPLTNSILRDTANALIQHADICRKLERRVSPAFASNLTQQQVGEKKFAPRRADRREG